MKRCTKCGEAKPLDAFYARTDRAGTRSHCRSCSARGGDATVRRRELRSEEPERAIRSQMIQRCTNARNPSFPDYGGRGIGVCAQWLDSFEAFLADMGARPSPMHSIERTDTNGNYEPGNCRWATRTEQNRNTRQNVLLTIDGRTQCRSAWAEEAGIRANVVRDRMEKLGWDAKRAVYTPTRACRRVA